MMLIPQTLDGFDVEEAVARMLDRPELWWQAVGFFVHHFAGWKTEWQGSVGNDSAERRLVHAVRSAAANVGAVDLAAVAARLETVLLMRLDGKPEVIPADLRERLAVSFDQAWGGAAQAWADAGCDLPEQP